LPTTSRVGPAGQPAGPTRLIIGKGGKSQVATLVERSTRFLMLVGIPYDRTADRVVSRLSTHVNDLSELLKRSLTWD
jgi:IS30 family transposase